jgi:hypothetical protein
MWTNGGMWEEGKRSPSIQPGEIGKKRHKRERKMPDRVRAHILLCMPAYYVEWHMRQLLTSSTFIKQPETPARSDRFSRWTMSIASAMRGMKAIGKRAIRRIHHVDHRFVADVDPQGLRLRCGCGPVGMFCILNRIDGIKLSG